MMIFWLVLLLILEISYNRVIINILKDFWFLFRGFFLKIIFLYGEIFEFA
jgi:hypothetical protein